MPHREVLDGVLIIFGRRLPADAGLHHGHLRPRAAAAAHPRDRAPRCSPACCCGDGLGCARVGDRGARVRAPPQPPRPTAYRRRRRSTATAGAAARMIGPRTRRPRTAPGLQDAVSSSSATSSAASSACCGLRVPRGGAAIRSSCPRGERSALLVTARRRRRRCGAPRRASRSRRSSRWSAGTRRFERDGVALELELRGRLGADRLRASRRRAPSRGSGHQRYEQLCGCAATLARRRALHRIDGIGRRAHAWGEPAAARLAVALCDRRPRDHGRGRPARRAATSTATS